VDVLPSHATRTSPNNREDGIPKGDTAKSDKPIAPEQAGAEPALLGRSSGIRAALPIGSSADSINLVMPADPWPRRRVEQLAYGSGQFQTPALTVDTADPADLTGKEEAATVAGTLPLVRPTFPTVLGANTFFVNASPDAVVDQLQLGM
jgi:hypothetical protein